MLVLDDKDWDQKRQIKKNHKNDATFLTVFSFPLRLKLNAEKTAKKIITKYSKIPKIAIAKIKKVTNKNFSREYKKYLESNSNPDFQTEDGFYAKKTKETIFLNFWDEVVMSWLNYRNPYNRFYYKIPDSQKFEKIKKEILTDFNESEIFNFLDGKTKSLIRRLEANKIEKSKMWICAHSRKPLSNQTIKKIKKFLRYQAIEGWGDVYEKKELAVDDDYFFTVHLWTYKNKKWKVEINVENKKIS